MRIGWTGKTMLFVGLLSGAGIVSAQTPQEQVVVEAVGLTRFCGAHGAKTKDLPARLAAELTPKQRASLDAMKTKPEYLEDSKKMDQDLATLPPQAADELCGKLAGLPTGGILKFIQQDEIFSGLMSFYPAVVATTAQEYQALPLAERTALVKQLADTLGDPKSDNIARGRVQDAFRAIGADTSLASGELAEIIRQSAHGQRVKSDTVVFDPPLQSGNAVSNSATMTSDDSDEIMSAAFALLAGTKPLPVSTLCGLANDTQKKVREGATQIFNDAKLSAKSTCTATSKPQTR